MALRMASAAAFDGPRNWRPSLLRGGGGRAARLKEVAEEFLDGAADGVSRGFRRTAKLAAVFAQVGGDLLQLLPRFLFCCLCLAGVIDGFFEFPSPLSARRADLVFIVGEGELVECFRAGRGGTFARDRVIDFYAASPLGLGRGVLAARFNFLSRSPGWPSISAT